MSNLILESDFAEFTLAERLALKVGDDVMLTCGSYSDRATFVAKISKATKATVTVSTKHHGAYRFWRKNGAEIAGDTWWAANLQKKEWK